LKDRIESFFLAMMPICGMWSYMDIHLMLIDRSVMID
jgi:hypothetical protein